MKKAYIHYEGENLVTSLRNHVPQNVVCECPKDDEGKYVYNLDFIEIEDVYVNFPDENGEITRVKSGGKIAKVSDMEACKAHKPQRLKEIEAQIKINKQKKTAMEELKVINWDTAKIADVRKAIKFLLGVE